MTISIVPAQAGFYYVEDYTDTAGRKQKLHLPVIAWAVDTSREDLYVSAIGVDGRVDGDCPVYRPDGKLAHA